MGLTVRSARLIFVAGVLGFGGLSLAQSASTRPADARAENGNASAPAERGRSRNGRNFTAAQMQRLQDSLQATDDEWKIIQPRIEKIESLRRSNQSSRTSSRGRRGNSSGSSAGMAPAVSGSPTQAPASGEQTELQIASQQLQQALNNKDTPPQELKARLAALREARAHALEELTKTQEELRDILTSRQEAVLVTLGLLN